VLLIIVQLIVKTIVFVSIKFILAVDLFAVKIILAAVNFAFEFFILLAEDLFAVEFILAAVHFAVQFCILLAVELFAVEFILAVVLVTVDIKTGLAGVAHGEGECSVIAASWTSKRF
jgi:hypothetical protein